jgi:hypothetical protein
MGTYDGGIVASAKRGWKAYSPRVQRTADDRMRVAEIEKSHHVGSDRGAESGVVAGLTPPTRWFAKQAS